MKKTSVFFVTLFLTAAIAALPSLAGCSAAAVGSQTAAATAATTATAGEEPSASEPTSALSAQTAASEPTLQISEEDLEAVWDEVTATRITLEGESIAVSGEGALADGSIVTITKAGAYVVSGTLAKGQIRIAATNKDIVRLVLNDAHITNPAGAPIYASQCEKLIVTLAGSTGNSLTDGGAGYLYEDTVEEEPNAALFSKDDLTINGSGSLTVTAGFNNGVGTKDDLLIAGGNITVTAANHGLRGNDSLTMLEGDLRITARKDGLNTKGNLTVKGGNVNIEQSVEGLEGDNVYITGGGISIVSSDDGINAASDTDTDTAGAPFGQGGGIGGNDGGSHIISISGGDITIFAGGDGIDSNGSIAISGGKIISIIDSQANGAMDCDGAFTLTGGVLIYGGTEAGNLPGADSTQSYVYVTDISAGTEITVKKEGKTLIFFTPSVNCQALALSSPDIVSGQNYEVYKGEDLLAEVTAGTGGQMGGPMNGRGGRGDRGGMRPEGQAPQGTPPEGARPEGMGPGGMQPPNGTQPNGTAPESVESGSTQS